MKTRNLGRLTGIRLQSDSFRGLKVITDASRVLSLVAIRRTNLRVADTWHFAAIFAGVCLPSARCGRRGLKSARYLAQSN
jgi:hypothetical protein